MRLLNELLNEMGEYEEQVDKKYVDKDEAKMKAEDFMDRASGVLSHNKKDGSSEEIEGMALQSAKDFYEQMCDCIKGKRYEGRDKGDDDMDMEDEMGDEGMDRERGDEEFM